MLELGCQWDPAHVRSAPQEGTSSAPSSGPHQEPHCPSLWWEPSSLSSVLGEPSAGLPGVRVLVTRRGFVAAPKTSSPGAVNPDPQGIS